MIVARRRPDAAARTAPAGAPSTRRPEPSDLAVVLFTSGSTGAPKGVLHTQRGARVQGRASWSARTACGADDCVLMPAPLAHISGLLNGVLLPGVVPYPHACSWRGGTRSTRSTLIERERVTFMVGPPTFFVALMQAPGFSPARVASLRLVSSGGAGVTPAFVDDGDRRARRAREAHVRLDRGADDHDEHRRRPRRRAPATPTAARSGDGRAARSAGATASCCVRGPRAVRRLPRRRRRRAPRSRRRLVPHRRPRDDRRRRLAHDRRPHEGRHHPRRREHRRRRGRGRARGAPATSARRSRSATPTSASASGCARSSSPTRRSTSTTCRRWFAAARRRPLQDARAGRGVDELPVLAAGKPDRAALRALATDWGQ